METASSIQQTSKAISILIKARYPIIYVVSYEENRVREILKSIAINMSMDVVNWSVTGGYKSLTDSKAKPEPADPLQIFDYAFSYDKDAIFILNDINRFFENNNVVRKVRDVVNHRPDNHICFVIVSPVLNIPIELEKSISVIDMALPNQSEIRELVVGAVEQINKRKPGSINMSDSELRNIIDALTGLTSDEIENILAKSWIAERKFNVSIILDEKKQIVRKGGILEYCEANYTCDDIGGLNLLKDWLKARSNAFSEEARKFGLPCPKGILLLGIPGSGKSLTAKAISSLWQMPLIRMDFGKIFAGIVGASEANMRKAIKTVEAIAPCVLFIDEIEKGLSGTGSSDFCDAGTASRVFGTFLQWMNDKNTPVFVVATANNVSQLPPELLRKGRFDEIFFVSLPDKDDRKEIFKIHIERPRELHPGRDASKFDLDVLAELTKGYSGSEIEQAVVSGMFKAFQRGEELVSEHIVEAINETVPLSVTMHEQISYLKNWVRGRARHASTSNEKDSVQQISAIRPVLTIKRRKRDGQ